MSFSSIPSTGYQTPIHYSSDLQMNAEQELVSTIRRLLYTHFAPVRDTMAYHGPEDNITQALKLFRQIQNQSSKIEAFALVIFSKEFPRSKEFYYALPIDLQNEFKHQLWISNSCSDNGMGVSFSDHYVENIQLCGNSLAMQAVLAMRSN